jgi:hypothetical protein
MDHQILTDRVLFSCLSCTPRHQVRLPDHEFTLSLPRLLHAKLREAQPEGGGPMRRHRLRFCCAGELSY